MQNTGLILTQEEIQQRYDSEWVLLADPITAEDLTVLRGTVLWHSKDRDEVYRKLLEMSPNASAILYTGTMPKNVAINL
jgi:hypothetical protein